MTVDAALRSHEPNKAAMPTPAPSAVRFFPGDHPAVINTVRGALEKHRQKLMEDLILAADWPNFKERIGQIRGVDDALQALITADQEYRRASNE